MTSLGLTASKTETFLSYNRNDSVAVSDVARELRARGAYVWMDESNLVPGVRWQNEITEALDRAGSIAVCIGRHGLGGWQKIELEMALAKLPERSSRIVPILLADAPRSLTLPPQLSPYMVCDLRALDRAAQLDNVAAVLLADIEWPSRSDQPKRRAAGKVPGWLQAFFDSAGKTLFQRELLSDALSTRAADFEHIPAEHTRNDRRVTRD